MKYLKNQFTLWFFSGYRVFKQGVGLPQEAVKKAIADAFSLYSIKASIKEAIVKSTTELRLGDLVTFQADSIWTGRIVSIDRRHNDYGDDFDFVVNWPNFDSYKPDIFYSDSDIIEWNNIRKAWIVTWKTVAV